MSIRIGTTKTTPNLGSTKGFITFTDGGLVWPQAAFRAMPGERNTPASAQYGYLAIGLSIGAGGVAYVDPDGAGAGLIQSQAGGWCTIMNGAMSSINVHCRYRCELKLDTTAAITVGIGLVRIDAGSAAWVGGVDVYVDQNWHAYDFTFNVTLTPNAIYSPVIRYWIAHLVERNAMVALEIF